MTQFWLNNFSELINMKNFSFMNTSLNSNSENHIKILNLVSILSIIIGLSLFFITKKPIFIGMVIIVLSLTILIKSNLKVNSSFTKVNKLSNAFDTGAYLIKNVTKSDPSGLNNIIYINEALNFNKGDVIALTSEGQVLETNIISDIKYTIDTNSPVLILLKNLKGVYSKYTTQIAKVSDSTPNIFPPPDGNTSIQGAMGGTGDPTTMVMERYPKFDLPNQNRYDWNLELSTMGGNPPGDPPNYLYQGQPYGDLKCRNTNINNPMGTVNVTEYDSTPTMFGTCNVAEMSPTGRINDYQMTDNQEATVSQSRNDLLFHRGNSQMQYSPMPVDTIPNNQEAFAHFCYRSPTNLVNPKYASIFVNDPDKFKLVAKLARATGTENGGGGGGK